MSPSLWPAPRGGGSIDLTAASAPHAAGVSLEVEVDLTAGSGGDTSGGADAMFESSEGVEEVSSGGEPEIVGLTCGSRPRETGHAAKGDGGGDEDVEWEDVEEEPTGGAEGGPGKGTTEGTWRDRMAARQRYWSTSHGFRLGEFSWPLTYI